MGVYDGRSRADLQARLSALQTVYDQLASGQQVASASYSQSDGARAVTYRATDLVRLQNDILLLQKKLGIICRARGQIRVIYR
ncbi:gpW family head-tail joining protein [Burkholderia multivorans]|uniref:gpW family head-tail joining protein n=1 Tax=Burkholderia multivorans TaxID=87883 RepID=UPI000669936A|nr:gpW family head-tail joining protein [Burkholderia multivorans]MDN7871277.1 gpW family head-tail joining protein [Burkholderia multivorans]MDN7965485.1 gpW family head-tail joining protein [Burkholderia multivorans]MDN7998058.1 gpW family head-tail joining protein [Burkholderia multivorans]PRG49402.1 phage head-tail adapter protein [Burkholderia multivorans]